MNILKNVNDNNIKLKSIIIKFTIIIFLFYTIDGLSLSTTTSTTATLMTTTSTND